MRNYKTPPTPPKTLYLCWNLSYKIFYLVSPYQTGIFFFYFIFFSGSIVKLEDDNNLEPKNGDIVGSSPAPLMQVLFIHHRPFRHGSGNRTLVCTLVIMYRFLGTFTHTQVSNFFGSCRQMVGTLNSFICSLLKNGGISWPSLWPSRHKEARANI
jgi:hypothetical protein